MNTLLISWGNPEQDSSESQKTEGPSHSRRQPRETPQDELALSFDVSRRALTYLLLSGERRLEGVRVYVLSRRHVL